MGEGSVLVGGGPGENSRMDGRRLSLRGMFMVCDRDGETNEVIACTPLCRANTRHDVKQRG